MFSREIPMTGKRTKGGLPTDTSRVRVDPAQTSFFEGREFRSFKELNIAGSSTYVMRAVVPKNVILFGFEVQLDSGFLRLANYKDGTAGGTWAETLPIFSTNNMSVGPDRASIVTPTVVITAGGTYANDGTLFDLLRMKVSTASGQASSVGSSPSDERGVAAGTYYLSSKTLVVRMLSPVRSRYVGKSGHKPMT